MGRFGIKLVLLLLLISGCAFVVSLVLVDDVLQVSTSTFRGHNQDLERELRRAPLAYRELLITRGRLRSEIAGRIARAPLLTQAVWSREAGELRTALAVYKSRYPDIRRLAVRDPSERLVAAVGTSGKSGSRHRVFHTIGATGWTLVVGFDFPHGDQERLNRAAKIVEHQSVALKRINRQLERRYWLVFARILLVAMLIVTVIGVLFARRFARRLGRLSRATRRVAGGDLDVAVPTRSRDEIGQLNSAFNEMVAELRRNRAQIAYLQKISAWQEVARRLAHEIKNPLTPILLSIQQVQGKYQGEDAQFRKLLDDASEIVNEEVDGLRRLVEAFSAFAKLPQVELESEEITDLMDDFRRSLGVLEDQGEVEWVPPEPGFAVMVDRLLFRRVLHNLVQNSFQAAQELGKRPHVEIRARRLVHSGVAVVTLTDNGPGVPDDLRERIFDPYFTTKSSGTGLGLAIVKKIILEHGGSIDVETPSEGGTRFTIRIPVAK